MMLGRPTLVFGTSAKQQVADRIRAHISEKFGNNIAKAAKSLGISRQRLFSYAAAKALPRSAVFDLFFQKWGLDLLGAPSRATGAKSKGAGRQRARPVQISLFDNPITLKNDDLI